MTARAANALRVQLADRPTVRWWRAVRATRAAGSRRWRRSSWSAPPCEAGYNGQGSSATRVGAAGRRRAAAQGLSTRLGTAASAPSFRRLRFDRNDAALGPHSASHAPALTSTAVGKPHRLGEPDRQQQRVAEAARRRKPRTPPGGPGRARFGRAPAGDPCLSPEPHSVVRRSGGGQEHAHHGGRYPGPAGATLPAGMASSLITDLPTEQWHEHAECTERMPS